MKISIGNDHGGLELKNAVVPFLTSLGHQVIDHGTNTFESCDYTDFGYQVAMDVATSKADRGIVICTTGIGMSIIANKVEGVRCALVDSIEFAVLTREHNDSNVLALGQKAVSTELALEIVEKWLNTKFSMEEKHQRRINKISKYEEGKL